MASASQSVKAAERIWPLRMVLGSTNRAYSKGKYRFSSKSVTAVR
jgi:hypothetical protein